MNFSLFTSQHTVKTLTPWCWIFFEKLTVTQLVEEYATFFM